jgi:tetratricopeptide (TPR) repeat protein
VLIKQARESTQHGDHAGAVQIWKRIIEEYGSTAQAWSGMADALEAAGHVEKGFQCRTKANELLMQEEKKEVPDGGVDLVAAAIQAKLHSGNDTSTNQDDVNVSIEWYNKGLTLLGEDKGVEALNCFEKAISSAPREEREIRVRAHNGRGHALHQLGRFSESIQSYHQAISMDPTMVTGRTLYNMGSSYAAMEHFTDAIRCFEQALDRDLDEEEERLCKTQMNRCSLLLKEQRKTERIQS